MRAAIRISRVADRAELSICPLDAQRLLELASIWELEVFVDSDGVGAGALRAAGLPVHINPKRTAHRRGTSMTGDESQVQLLAEHHADKPFDVILESADFVSAARHCDPRLADVPHGVFPIDILADMNIVVDDPQLFGELGRRLWAATGHLCSADFVLTNRPLEELGLSKGLLPPQLTLDDTEFKSGSGKRAGSVVVMATTVGRAALTGLVTRAAERIDPGATMVVVHRDLAVEGGRVRDLVLGSVPESIRLRTLVVAAGPDGIAAAFLASAGSIVLASPAELMIPALADQISTVPVTCLETVEPVSLPPFTLGAVAAQVERPGVVVPYDHDQLPAAIERALKDNSPGVVLFESSLELASRMAESVNWSCVDLAVYGPRDAVLGGPDATRAVPTVLGFGAGVGRAVLAQASNASSLGDLVVKCLDPTLVDRARLLVLGAPADSRVLDLPLGHRTDLAPWPSDSGLLRRPYLAHEGVTVTELESMAGIREWTQSHRFGDRIRLALPWKWGLLPKAMRGRW